MKRNFPSDTQQRFRSSLRHYHRTHAQAQRSWDDWVDGSSTKSRVSKNWLKILGIGVAVVGLLAIFAGLFIELA
jgi:hypothetical protein